MTGSSAGGHLAQFLGYLVRLLLELHLIALPVFGVLGHRHIFADFYFEFVMADDLSRGKQGARRPIALIQFRNVNRIHDLRHINRVDFVAGLHHLLFEVEEDLGKARLLFSQSKHGFIYHLQPKSSLHACSMRVGDLELDARVATGPVGRCVWCRLDFQFVGWLHKEKAVISNWGCVLAEKVGTDIYGPGHVGSRSQREFRLTILQVEIACQHCLTVFDDVYVCGAPLLT